ncbi:hypothetical protein JKG47_00895 [Acidithiobacillus sp. MC6.1]|nr:hypothetical protein [Acidithiobacillus sp. MC6.1]
MQVNSYGMCLDQSVLTRGWHSVEDDGCIFLYGNIPLTELGRILKNKKRHGDSVMDMHLARMAMATMVIGPEPRCAALHKKYGEVEKERVFAAYPGLSEPAKRWLATGKQGLSSSLLFFAMTGIKPFYLQNKSTTELANILPQDAADFRLCDALLSAVPEFAGRLDEVARLYPLWAPLVENWDTLKAMLLRQWKEGEENRGSPFDAYLRLLYHGQSSVMSGAGG